MTAWPTALWRLAVLGAAGLLACAAAGCRCNRGVPGQGGAQGGSAGSGSAAPITPRPVSVTAPAAQAAAPAALVARGKALVARYQCNRCHAGTGHGEPNKTKRCVGCHADIHDRRYPKSKRITDKVLATWRHHIVDLIVTPSLARSGARLTRAGIERLLLHPYDLRPRLRATMPRLSMPAADARAIAAYLAPAAAPRVTLRGDAAAGRRVLATKGCMTCHTFSGVKPIDASQLPVTLAPKRLERAIKLAPDLRHTRRRVRWDTLVAWLRDPRKLAPKADMPAVGLSEKQARDAAAFILSAKLAPPRYPPVPKRLPLLERRVSYDEVQKRVFKRICWHCHSEPAYAIGDGGPGNTGGFGFKPRGLNLASYEGVSSGRFDAKGERESIFRPLKSGPLKGVPRLLAALLARQLEVAGKPLPDLRGMPLGLPPMPPEEIQLVASWIAQGRPR